MHQTLHAIRRDRSPTLRETATDAIAAIREIPLPEPFYSYDPAASIASGIRERTKLMRAMLQAILPTMHKALSEAEAYCNTVIHADAQDIDDLVTQLECDVLFPMETAADQMESEARGD